MTTENKNEICAWLLKEWNLSVSNDNELLPIYNAFRISNIQLSEINQTSKEFLTVKLATAISNLKQVQDELNEKSKKELEALIEEMKKQEELFIKNTKKTLDALNVKQYNFNYGNSVKEWWQGKIKFWLWIIALSFSAATIGFYGYRQLTEIKLVSNFYNDTSVRQNEFGETYFFITNYHMPNSNETGFELERVNKKISGVKIFISNK